MHLPLTRISKFASSSNYKVLIHVLAAVTVAAVTVKVGGGTTWGLRMGLRQVTPNLEGK